MIEIMIAAALLFGGAFLLVAGTHALATGQFSKNRIQTLWCLATAPALIGLGFYILGLV